MPARRWWPVLVAVAAWLVLPACAVTSSSGVSSRPEGPPLAPTPTPVALQEAPATARFPVAVSGDGRYVVDASGRPFLIAGEAAWSLLVQLKLDEVRAYAADRRVRGFNSVLVNLVEHRYADDAPRNAYGEAPFRPGAAFSQPNPSYFDQARQALEVLRDEGLVVFLVPAYLGYGGGDDGWTGELERAGEEACAAYGRFVAQRFGDLDNVVWVAGGDFSPRAGSKADRCTARIIETVHAAAPAALVTGHWAPETRATSQVSVAGLINLEGVYTYHAADAACVAAIGSPRPVFLFETTYENEHGATARSLRLQYYRAALACPAGQFIGARPMWLFDDGWEAELDSVGTRQAEVGASLLRSLDWWTLEWSPGVVLSSPGERIAAVGRGSGIGVFYFPSLAPGSTATIDGDRLGGRFTATFVDPSTGANGEVIHAAGPGKVVVTAPGKNAAGDTDWLVVTRPAP